MTDPREGESADLLRAGRYILQKRDGFKFGLDAVLLADFAVIRKGDEVCDLCSGGGIIPVLTAGRAARVVGVELQRPYVEMGRRSLKLNGIENAELLEGDLRRVGELLDAASFQVVTVNPPYLKAGAGVAAPQSEINIAKQELCATIEDVARAAAYLLKPNGRLYLVHRPERLCDIVCALRAVRLEPKRGRMVYPAEGRPPSLILIEARAGVTSGMRFEPPLTVMRGGEESGEIKAIYAGRREDRL